MAETIGSLCDKLTIVKLKQFHTLDKARIASLDLQQKQLSTEIDAFINDAISGVIPLEKLIFESNKVYKSEGNSIRNISGGFGEIFSELAKINCELWHEQEKVYEFEAVPEKEKNQVVKKLAILNLERNKCIDELNNDIYQKIKAIAES